jgi:hypothetical protein
LNPAFDLGVNGATRGEDDDRELVAHPAGFDSGESFLFGIRKNTKFEMAFGEFRAVSEDCGFEPISGRSIVVLREDTEGPGMS